MAEPNSAPASKVSAATIGAAIGGIVYELAAQAWQFLQDQSMRLLVQPQIMGAFSLAFGWFKEEIDVARKTLEGNRRWLYLVGGLTLVAASTGIGMVVFG